MEILVLLSSLILIYSAKWYYGLWLWYMERSTGIGGKFIRSVRYISYAGWILLVVSSVKIVYLIIIT